LSCRDLQFDHTHDLFRHVKSPEARVA